MQKAWIVAALLLVESGACGPLRSPSESGASTLSAAPVASVGAPATAVPSHSAAAESGAAANVAFPDPDAFTWHEVASGLESPVDIQFADDGTARMFVVEQAGRIRIFQGAQLEAAPFLDITDRVDSNGDEQGLLGLAFHMQYAKTGLFFVNYTDHHHHNVIARFRVSSDPDRADPTSEKTLISIDDPFPNHNGGVLAFGPDGYLYAGLGDGGSSGDPFGNGQNTNTLLGKILRVDVDGGDPYAIPADNPFANGGGSPEVWAYGLRNPWRLSFDRSTGDLFIADVGQNLWEEVDFLPAGSSPGTNLGWNYREGKHSYSGAPPPSLQLTDPVAEYSHGEGGCAVTGGHVYRGAMREWQGIYLYGDYCSGEIWGLMHQAGAAPDAGWQSRLLFETGANITTFGEDPNGEVYFASRGGSIYRLEKKP
jgi:glucose/arabinose dehydrogenase